MRKVHLHGALARFGGPFSLEIDTAGEAVRALLANIPALDPVLREGHYRLVRGAVDGGFDIGLEALNSFRLGSADLHIVPVITGAKSGGGALKIVAGLALVGAAIFFAPAGAGLIGANLAAPLGTGLLSGVSYGTVAMVGLGLVVAGVSTMIAQPETPKERDDSSHTLSGAINSTAQGTPIPLVYGEVLTGGLLASVGMDIEDISKANSSNNKGVGSL